DIADIFKLAFKDSEREPARFKEFWETYVNDFSHEILGKRWKAYKELPPNEQKKSNILQLGVKVPDAQKGYLTAGVFFILRKNLQKIYEESKEAMAFQAWLDLWDIKINSLEFSFLDCLRSYDGVFYFSKLRPDLETSFDELAQKNFYQIAEGEGEEDPGNYFVNWQKWVLPAYWNADHLGAMNAFLSTGDDAVVYVPDTDGNTSDIHLYYILRQIEKFAQGKDKLVVSNLFFGPDATGAETMVLRFKPDGTRDYLGRTAEFKKELLNVFSQKKFFRNWYPDRAFISLYFLTSFEGDGADKDLVSLMKWYGNCHLAEDEGKSKKISQKEAGGTINLAFSKWDYLVRLYADCIFVKLTNGENVIPLQKFQGDAIIKADHVYVRTRPAQSIAESKERLDFITSFFWEYFSPGVAALFLKTDEARLNADRHVFEALCTLQAHQGLHYRTVEMEGARGQPLYDAMKKFDEKNRDIDFFETFSDLQKTGKVDAGRLTDVLLAKYQSLCNAYSDYLYEWNISLVREIKEYREEYYQQNNKYPSVYIVTNDYNTFKDGLINAEAMSDYDLAKLVLGVGQPEILSLNNLLAENLTARRIEGVLAKNTKDITITLGADEKSQITTFASLLLKTSLGISKITSKGMEVLNKIAEKINTKEKLNDLVIQILESPEGLREWLAQKKYVKKDEMDLTFGPETVWQTNSPYYDAKNIKILDPQALNEPDAIFGYAFLSNQRTVFYTKKDGQLMRHELIVGADPEDVSLDDPSFEWKASLFELSMILEGFMNQILESTIDGVDLILSVLKGKNEFLETLPQTIEENIDKLRSGTPPEEQKKPALKTREKKLLGLPSLMETYKRGIELYKDLIEKRNNSVYMWKEFFKANLHNGILEKISRLKTPPQVNIYLNENDADMVYNHFGALIDSLEALRPKINVNIFKVPAFPSKEKRDMYKHLKDNDDILHVGLGYDDFEEEAIQKNFAVVFYPADQVQGTKEYNPIHGLLSETATTDLQDPYGALPLDSSISKLVDEKDLWSLSQLKKARESFLEDALTEKQKEKIAVFARAEKIGQKGMGKELDPALAIWTYARIDNKNTEPFLAEMNILKGAVKDGNLDPFFPKSADSSKRGRQVIIYLEALLEIDQEKSLMAKLRDLGLTVIDDEGNLSLAPDDKRVPIMVVMNPSFSEKSRKEFLAQLIGTAAYKKISNGNSVRKDAFVGFPVYIGGKDKDFYRLLSAGAIVSHD
ncbi:MAG: hypothetical protein NT079_02300, partial [Candidatus Omnitrophica bacterium]|nr:hypothetical protein [Candidatus Omnitrophota bacterium]